jgi:presenilin-like A22 family membrane protease
LIYDPNFGDHRRLLNQCRSITPKMKARGKMPYYIHRPRQVVGLLYILTYTIIFFTYAVILRDDQSWTIEPKFTVVVILWFILSIAVKISMFMDRTIELLNLLALVALMSIGLIYSPHPGHFSSIENFCYYLNFIGGSVCDFFDFLYESPARHPENKL